MKTITLTGMMGSGKSTVAKALSQILNCELLEIDSLIEHSKKLIINEIFEKLGEKYFREVEKQTILTNAKPDNQIIAIGGGAFEDKETREFLLKNTTVIYLKTSSETIFQRIKNDTSRPLLNNQMSTEKIEEIIKKRQQNYEKATLTVYTDNKTIEEITTEIRRVLGLWKNYKCT